MIKLQNENATAPFVLLNNGKQIPAIGLGTYEVAGDAVEKAVKDAIDSGYRHIDTAFFYKNEKEVGNAIREKIEEGVVERSDMFITTKLWSNFHEPEKVKYACQMSLKNLGLDYIDLYLIHWPFSFPHIGDFEFLPQDSTGTYLVNDIDYVDTWKAMEELVRKGMVRSIGLSNFNSEQIVRVLKSSTIKPVMNQIECSPSISQRKLIEFCKERDILVTAYTPLAKANVDERKPDFLFNEDVIAIGKKYGKTAVQVTLRYLFQLGTVPIPKSVNKNRIQENILIFDFNLTVDEMNVMGKFNRGIRTARGLRFSHSKHYPFHIEF